MKLMQISAAILFFCVSTATPAHQVDQRARTQAISGEPMDLPIFVRLSGRYQLRVQEHVAITIPFGLQYVGASIATQVISSALKSYYLADLGIGARFYFTDEVFQDSWFLEPVAVAGYLYGSEPVSSAFLISPKLLAGYNWFWENGLMLSYGLGIQYPIFLTSSPLPSLFTLHFPLPTWEIAVGYSW